jgi:pimeloyl-ACP methyl ester carboxylesterase
MATIFTVHGTFASGPEVGDKWWQKEGIIDSEIRSYVSSDDGTIEIKPIIWTGANSELARREGAATLHDKINEFGTGPCVVIGHSHGGAVIDFAAMQRNSTTTFEKVSAVITVATPYLIIRKSRSLFNRVDVVGKSLLTFSVFWVVLFSLIFARALDFFSWLSVAQGLWYMLASPREWVLFGLPVAAAYFALRLSSAKRFARYRASLSREMKPFISRWTCLYDRNDEAIGGLGSLKTLHLQLFDDHFSFGPLSVASVFIVPLAFVLLCSIPPIMVAFLTIADGSWQVASFPRGFTGSDPWLNAKILGGVAYDLLKKPIYYANTTLAGTNWEWLAYLIYPLLTGMSFLASLLITLVGVGASIVASKIISKLLNPLARSGIRRNLLGADTMGEIAHHTQRHPTWMSVGFQPLPADLSEELNNFSNLGAATSIAEIRGILHQLAFLQSGSDLKVLLEKYLTWNELIHTSYFAILRFRKLLYYIISQSKGFSPTQSFQGDPDYALVAAWYAEIRQ